MAEITTDRGETDRAGEMVAERNIVRWEGGQARECMDTVVREEPLETILNGESFTVTMRTPGDDFALVTGFLYAEGIIESLEDVSLMKYAPCKTAQNRVAVTLRSDAKLTENRARLQHNVLTTSSCGMCSKTSLESVLCSAVPITKTDLRVSSSLLCTLNAKMRTAQQAFTRTGGLHAAALFDDMGTLLTLKEDVGRHNAVDKVIGEQVQKGLLPLSRHLLMVSGRAGYELVQKAAMAHIPIMAAVSAPSSLAIDLADQMNLTLIGFLRGETMNIYTHPERIL